MNVSSVDRLLSTPATELARLVAAGELSSAELVRAHLDGIAEINPRLNAFVDVRAEEALADARLQDEAAARGTARGPLGGVPVTVKSAIEVAGLRFETGSPAREGIVAAADAVVVSRMKAAGAIVLGTTNVANMLMAYDAENPLHGRTCHPLDATRTPGGSSGGEAAAIAAGCSAGGIGSDGGGSIRVPAHFSGICGLKPTPGRIPSTGHQPACHGPFSIIGVVGPMARTVADLALLFDAVAGWDHVDPMAMPVPNTAGRARKPIRIGFFEHDGRTPVTAETRDAVLQAARAAEAAGHIVEPLLPSCLEQARELWEVFFAEVGRLLLADVLGGAEDKLPILEEFARRRGGWPELTAHRLARAWIDRDTVRAQLLGEMSVHRILLCPVASIPAFRHGEREWTINGSRVRYLDAMSYTQWFNVLGNPVAVVPAGRSEGGLPIGVQIVGRPYEEDVVLDVANAIDTCI